LAGLIAASAFMPVVGGVRASLVSADFAQDHADKFLSGLYRGQVMAGE